MKQIIAGGLGFVGRAVQQLFPEAEIYDKGMDVPTERYNFCHVTTPTPMKEDGSCDTSAVEDVMAKVKAEIYIIRSTVPIGFLSKFPLAVMQPEYVASDSPYLAPLADIRKHPFIVLGGRPDAAKRVRRLYETIYPPTVQFVEMTSTEAEICKMMENSFIDNYVSFCNEFFDICQKYEADYDRVREGFLADPRMTKYWTYVYQSMRGWGGKCLPKDVSSLIYETGSPFMQAVRENNDRHKKTGIS
ncbi:MAG: hypothetical protein Q7S13_00160 [Candidatus Omnitrophota bacterium]|nr:hypothetical protein [Candidatus Omnitrophota bacterium]